ncbi:hypothetical protein [Streptomyces sp. NPDC052114]|uniref:hypothetical protein n=1 Tax=unclassified Streptomyces TaxID=2593676 RepID=UPI0034213B19
MRTDPPPSSSFVIDDSARDPEADIWFAEPAGFTVVPLDVLLNVPDASGRDALRTALAPVLDSAPDELARQRFLGQVGAAQQLLSVLCEAGTVYCAIGLHRDDVDGVDGMDGVGRDSGGGGRAGQPLLSLLTLSWRDVALAPPSVTAARAVASGGEGEARIEYVEGVACGPVSLREAVLTPVGVHGFGSAGPLLQVHAHLPHPDGRRLAVLTLSTQAVHRRDDYRRILRNVVDLVSFEDPLA